MKREFGAAGIGALAVLAVVGWTRPPQPAAAGSISPEPAPATLAMYSDTAPMPSAYPMPRVGVRTAVAPAVPSKAAVQTVAYRRDDDRYDRNDRNDRNDRYRQESRRTVRDRDTYDYRDGDYRDRRDTRSTGKSVAIIGGGAAAGAAIGGMAGGGKGAAIGAVTGGAAGLIYDRMTRKNGDKIF